jgi:hypothetical protein
MLVLSVFKIEIAYYLEGYIVENQQNQQWNERTAIQYRMNQLQGEMQSIRDEYERMLDRLRDLDRIEAQQKASQQQQGFFMTPPVPVSHQAVQEEPLHTQPPTTTQAFDETASTTINDVINETPTAEVVETQEKKSPKTEKAVAPKKNKQTSSKGKNKKPLKRSEEVQLKKDLIVSALKRNLRMNNNQLRSLMEENGLNINNITAFMSDVSKQHQEIIRIGRGVYDWRELSETQGQNADLSMENENTDQQNEINSEE